MAVEKILKTAKIKQYVTKTNFDKLIETGDGNENDDGVLELIKVNAQKINQAMKKKLENNDAFINQVIELLEGGRDEITKKLKTINGIRKLRMELKNKIKEEADSRPLKVPNDNEKDPNLVLELLLKLLIVDYIPKIDGNKSAEVLDYIDFEHLPSFSSATDDLEENIDKDYTNSTVLNYYKTQFTDSTFKWKKTQELSIPIDNGKRIKYSNNNPSVNQCVADFRMLLVCINYLVNGNED